MPETESPPPHPLLGPPGPLHGLTLLAVEDSRFTCEALRLIAQRSGARLRRAASLRDARRHLALYRPDVILVDLGLPDGSGTTLIRELAMAPAGGPVILGMSGDPDGRAAALAAGATGFLDKPFGSVAGFQAGILRHLPHAPVRPAAVGPLPEPDPLALREDLAHAARLLAANPDATQRAYLARFLVGLARSTQDPVLADAAATLPRADGERLAQLSGLVSTRMKAMPRAFP